MKSHSNKFLVVNPHVILTESIDIVIYELEAYAKALNLKGYITSGLRDANAQLRIIRSSLTRRGLADDYPEAFEDIDGKMLFKGKLVWNWQPGWSKLLNIGFIVNPPAAAEVLMNYFRPGSETNRIGTIIQPSPHFKGTAFDIGGGANGVADEMEMVMSALGKVKGLKGCLMERENNCCHVDCHLIGTY